MFNLISHGLYLTLHKIIFFIPHVYFSQNVWSKTDFKPIRDLYEPPYLTYMAFVLVDNDAH